MSEKQYYVYIMTNAHKTVLYTGVTNELQRRVLEHKSGKGSEFTKKYKLTKLIYFERGDDINVATPALHQTQCGAHLPRTQVPGSVAREKQIKAGSRKKKIELIEGINPEWKDLFEEYFGKKIV
jgi:putative endonuclease